MNTLLEYLPGKLLGLASSQMEKLDWGKLECTQLSPALTEAKARAVNWQEPQKLLCVSSSLSRTSLLRREIIKTVFRVLQEGNN